jgi:hypothetical protein
MLCKITSYFSARRFAAPYASHRFRVASAIASRPAALIFRFFFPAAFFAGVPVAAFASAQRLR